MWVGNQLGHSRTADPTPAKPRPSFCHVVGEVGEETSHEDGCMILVITDPDGLRTGMVLKQSGGSDTERRILLSSPLITSFHPPFPCFLCLLFSLLRQVDS